MKIPVMCLATLLMAACNPPAPDTSQANASAKPDAMTDAAAAMADVAASADSARTGDSAFGDQMAADAVAGDAVPVAPAGPAKPSFDCAKARSEAETLVCSDAELAALDRRMAEVYAQAKSAGTDENLPAMQRGWVKGRDECWKNDDTRQCVIEEYKTRLVQLQLDSNKVSVPTPVEYSCGDNSKRFTAVFYNDLDPQAAVLTWGDDQAIVFPARSGSGSKYTRAGVEFWEHQGEVTVDFYGTGFTCTTP